MIRNKIKYCIFLALLAVYYTLSGQSLKYEDILNSINSMNANDAFLLLSKYQRQDPVHPACYYELGKISYKWLKEYDPLIEYDYVMQFAYDVNLFYGLSNHYLDDKNYKKFRDYLLDVPLSEGNKKVEYYDIKQFIDKQIADAKNYENNVKEIYTLFNKAVSYYVECNQIFKEINTSYAKIKDIYLSTDKNLGINLNNLIVFYDSAVYYLNSYQKKIKEFPIGKYKQEFTIKEIITYRLDGLTGANFLSNQIELWDYNKWVNNINAIHYDDILGLRADIMRADKELNAALDFFKFSNKNADDLTGYKVNDFLKFRIGKYDHNSIILDLFNYKESKTNFLVSSRKKINSIDDTSKTNMLQRARYYQNLLDEWITMNLNLNSFSKKVIPYHVDKYADFFNDFYLGLEGLDRYIKEEQQSNDKLINVGFSNLKYFLNRENNKYKINLNHVPYKTYNIPLFIQKPDYNNLIPNQLYSLQIDEDLSENKYVTGIYVNSTNSTTQSFIAKINSKNSAEWVHFLTTKTGAKTLCQKGMLVQALDDGGCLVVVNSHSLNSEQKEIHNTLYKISSSGNINHQYILNREYFPRLLSYDEINDNFILAYKGQDIEGANSLEKLYIDLNDSICRNTWNQTMEIEGNILKVIRLNQNFLVFANVSKYINREGNIVKLKNPGNKNSNSSALLYTSLNQNGEIKQFQLYEANETYYASEVIKLNNTMINILGYKGIEYNPDITIKGSEPLLYILINPAGDKIYSNLK